MKRAGRVNWMVMVATAGAIAILAIAFLSGESATSVAGRFMEALGKGDVNALTELSYMDGNTPDQIKKKWEYTTTVPGKYYRFKWQLLNESTPAPDEAIVRLWVWRDFNTGGSYEENYQITLVKKDGKWKVDVLSLNRTMYPGLPR